VARRRLKANQHLAILIREVATTVQLTMLELLQGWQLLLQLLLLGHVAIKDVGVGLIVVDDVGLLSLLLLLLLVVGERA